MRFITKIISLVLLSIHVLSSQSLEPRLYSNAPVGLNFFITGYSYSYGALPHLPDLGLLAPSLKVDTTFLAYAKVFEAFGQSGKIDIVLPFAKVYGTAIDEQGTLLTRDTIGIADTKIRLSYNFTGAPALRMKHYASYKQDMIVGASIQITIPTGKYNPDKLINISANRWALKPSLGISKAVGNFIFECSVDAEFYTANSNFYGNTTRKQDPLYSSQAHIIYNITRASWIGFDANYFWGGDYTIDGEYAHQQLENSRVGITLALPINKVNSLKLYGSKGVISRTGTNFDTFGIAWQYRWF